MKLHQLRYLAAVAQTGLNITAAAEKLHTSQPGVSKQIKLLEDELGFQIFVRDGRNLSRVTPAGQQVIDRAVRILREVQNIKRLSDDFKDEARGSLSIATTHTQARYVLPAGDQGVPRDTTPRCGCTCTRAPPSRSASWPRSTASTSRSPPARSRCSRATRCCPATAGTATWSCRRAIRSRSTRRPRSSSSRRTRSSPTCSASRGRRRCIEIFAKEGLVPNVVLTARDADVIKTYVRLGLGVGIVASMAIDPKDDADLVQIDTSHLFPAHTTWIGFRRGGLLRKYQLDFVQRFAPHLTKRVIERAAGAATQADVDELVKDLELPLR